MFDTSKAASERAVAATVTVIEDNDGLRTLLVRGLTRSGFSVVAFASAEAAARHLDREPCDIVVLDVRLPGKDGLALLRALRAAAFRGRVICLSGLDAVQHRVAALDAGADDYLVKPFSLEELRARMRALLRRRVPTMSMRLEHGDLRVDLRRHVALCGEAELGLSQKEMHLLTLFVEHPGQVLVRDYLLAEIWGPEGNGRPNLLDVAIRRLREKLAAGGATTRLRTVRGRGYRLG